MAKEQKSFPFASEATRQMGGHGLCFPSKKNGRNNEEHRCEQHIFTEICCRTFKKVLGLENLREHQLEALSGLLQGRDTIISQPTGLGKSVVYQLLPFAFDIHNILRSQEKSEETKGKLIHEVVNSKETKSIVVVIQSLISLMKDQMMTLKGEKITSSG